MDHVNDLLTHNVSVVDKLNGCLASCRISSKDAAIHGTALSRPLSLFRDVHCKFIGVQTNGRDRHACAGSNVVIGSFQLRSGKHTSSRSLSCNDHTVDGGTLRAVRRHRTHHVCRLTSALGNKSRGAAAIAVDCVDAAQSQHHFAHLIVTQTRRDRRISTVHLTEDDGAVCLDANHGAGCVRRGTLHRFGHQRTVLHQTVEISGNGRFLLTGQGSVHGAQFCRTIVINSQVGLGTRVNRRSTQDHTIPDHVAIGSIGVIRQCGIHSAHDIVAHVFIVGHSIGHLGICPIGFVVQIFGIKLINAVITRHDFQGLLGGIHLKDMGDLAVIALGVIQNEFCFCCAGSQRILLA